MDSDGIPVAFGISPGNDNEQNTLIPLERKMIEKFDISRFIVCTDAGLSSATNRYFNSYDREDAFQAGPPALYVIYGNWMTKMTKIKYF